MELTKEIQQASGSSLWPQLALALGVWLLMLWAARARLGGAAGRSTLGATISATPDEQRWFNTFRVGVWPA